MDGLEVPDVLAGGDVDGHQRGRVFVLLLAAVAAVVVDGRIAERQVDQAKLLVGRRHGPHVRRAARVGLALGRLGVVVGLAEVPRPQELAGDRVVAAHDARRGILRLAVVHLGAGDDHAAHDRRRCGDRVPAGHGVADAVLQVDLAVAAEIRAELAGARIHGEQPGVERAPDDPRRAERVGVRGGGVGVIGNAAAGGAVGDRVVGDLGVVAPFLAAGGGVDGDRDALRRAHVEIVADLQGRVFRRVFPGGLLVRHVAGVELPDLLQVAGVVRGDLVERRIARRMDAAAVGRPVRPGRRHLLRRRVAGLRRGVGGVGADQRGLAGGGELPGILHGGRLAGILGDRRMRGKAEPAEGDQRGDRGGGGAWAAGRNPVHVDLVDPAQHGQRQEHQDEHHGRRHDPGDLRPPVRSDLPEGPGEGEAIGEEIDPDGGDRTYEQQDRGDDEPGPGDRVVPGAAEGDEPDAAGEEAHTAHEQDSGQTHRQAVSHASAVQRRGIGWSVCHGSLHMRP